MKRRPTRPGRTTSRRERVTRRHHAAQAIAPEPDRPPPPIGHNRGPPLVAPPGAYYIWTKARKRAFSAPREVTAMRFERARRLGLTYEEYTLEILERGRHLSEADAERIAQIKAARRE